MDWIWGRYTALLLSGLLTIGLIPVVLWIPLLAPVLLLTLGLTMVGVYDMFQKSSNLRANFPLLGNLRYFFESVRPELRQYFWENDNDELPYSRNQRSMVYQRAKSVLAARPLGSIENMYEEDFSWLNHSISPVHVEASDFRTTVG